MSLYLYWSHLLTLDINANLHFLSRKLKVARKSVCLVRAKDLLKLFKIPRGSPFTLTHLSFNKQSAEWPSPSENCQVGVSKDCWRIFLFTFFFPSVFCSFLHSNHWCTSYLWSIRPDELNYLKWSIIVNLPAAVTISALGTYLRRLSRCLCRHSRHAEHSQIFISVTAN